MRRANVDGEVVLVVHVDGAGVPAARDARVVRADHELFRAAVIDALSRWRFTPGRRGAGSAGDSVRVTWEFRVEKHEDCPTPRYASTPCESANTAVDSAALGAPPRVTLDTATMHGASWACPIGMITRACVY